MSNVNDDRPLAKWTTGNLLGLFGFVAMIVTGWANLSDRITKVEASQENEVRSHVELKNELKTVNNNVIQLMIASGIKPQQEKPE